MHCARVSGKAVGNDKRSDNGFNTDETQCMTTMKRICIFLLLLGLLGCQSAKLYHAEPVMQFKDIPYPFPMESATVNGALVSYYDSKGTGMPIVLIHGLASNAGFWRYNLDELRQRGFRVIALDLPGYGKSGKAYSTPYSMQFFAETVRALLQHLGIEKAVWVGHSMGGQIALTAALLFPHAIEKMVLLSPAGFEAFKEGEGNWLRNSVTPDFIKKTPQERIRANIVANFYNWDDKWEWMVEERTRLVGAEEFDRFAYAVWKSVGAMLDGYVWDKLHTIAIPTLVIAGENDNLIPNPFLHGGRTRDVMEQGVAAMKNAKLIMVPECGHMIQMEKSEVVNQAIAAFVGTASAAK